MLLWLLACGGDWVDRGPRDPAETVTWQGWVYTAPPEGDDPAKVTDGTVTFTPEGDDPVEAEQPYPDYPGYWAVTLPAAAPVTVRVEGEGLYPAVWAGDAPAADGYWLAGALFGADSAYMDALWASLPMLPGVAAAPALRTVDVWGVASADDWDCAAVTVNDATPYCFAVADDGTLTRIDAGPFDYFFAFGLDPGDVRVDSGTGAAETYTAAGGDVVMAFWLTEDE